VVPIITRQVIRQSETINADLRGVDVHPIAVPLAWPDLFAVEFVGPGLQYRFVLDGQQVRSLYAQLHVRLVVAPRTDKLRDRALGAVGQSAAR
jgi:hypothetical protein